MGLSPTPFILLTFLYRVFCPLFWTPAHVFSVIINTIDIPIHSILSCILNTCRWYLLTSWMLLTTQHTGRMAEWSKALVLGTSHFGGMGSSPTPVILLTFLYKVLIPLYWTPGRGIFYHHQCYWPHNIQAGWLSGLRRLIKAPVTRVALVGVPLLSFCLHSYIKVFFHVFWTPAHGIFYHHECYWRNNIPAGWRSGVKH